MSEAGAEGLVAELRGLAVSLKRPGGKESRISKACARAADALEANARALSEAADAIAGERWHADEAARQRDEWQHRAEAAERQRDVALEALRPFASISDLIDSETEGFSGTDNLNMFVDESDYLLDRIKVGAFRAARSVLENSKAGLADANPPQSPLSQDQEIAGLREEVRRKDEALRLWSDSIVMSDDGRPISLRAIGMGYGGDVQAAAAATRSALSPLDGEA